MKTCFSDSKILQRFKKFLKIYIYFTLTMINRPTNLQPTAVMVIKIITLVFLLNHVVNNFRQI